MNQNLKYRADLAQTSLPEMLYTIDRFRVPGIIEAKRQGVVKQVYIRDGYVIHASSSDLNDSLGAYLQRSTRLSADQFDRLTREREASNKRFGVLLIEQAALSPAEVLQSIREQIGEIVWSLFYWQSGEVTYGLGELRQEEMVQIQLPIGQVVVEGMKRAPDPRPLVSRLGRKETVLEPCFRGEDLIQIGLCAEDYRLLSLVDGRRTLYQLCSEGPGTAGDNAKLLYAFQVLHLIRRQGARRESAPSGAGPVKVRLRTSGDGFPG